MIIKRKLRLLLNKYKVNTVSFLNVKKASHFLQEYLLNKIVYNDLQFFKYISMIFSTGYQYTYKRMFITYILWILNNQNEIISIIIIFNFCWSLDLKKKEVVSYCRNKQLLTCMQVSKTEMKIWGNPYLKIETHKTNTC